MSISSSELEGILAERLDLARREKSVIREAIEDLEGRIRNSRKLLANAPRETEEELVTTMQKLERSHATTSQSNADEREFMREMDKLRQKRKAAANFVKVKAEVDDMRNRLNDLRKNQAAMDDTISELHSGLRKVKIANKAGCSSAEVVERKLTVETSKIARIVGKGGSNLRFIEDEHCVSIEIDSVGGSVRILGTEAAITGAVEAIMTIVETSIEEFSLSDEVIVCMMMEKAQLVNDIQGQYGVRLDISRAKNLCKVTGLTDSVAAAKAHIQSLQCVRTDMLMEPTAVSAIIGKGGASITALQEEFRVAINVNRDRNTVEVVGMRPDVAAALARIKDIIEDNREVEEVMQLEKHVLMGCLMGANGGQGLRSIAKDVGVRIDTDLSAKDSPLQSIRIKGSNGKVHQAKTAVIHAVGEYVSTSVVVEVPDDVIPAILGKAGSGIKALRKKYADANIDIDGVKVHIQSAAEEVRSAVKSEIEAILEANYSQLVAFDDDGKSQLRSAQGADIRNTLTKDLNVRLVIDATPTAVKVRGARADVLRAVEALEAFKRTHTSDRLVLPEEDYLLLTNPRTKGGENTIISSLAAQYNADIKSQRKELSLFINGSPDGVAEVRAAIRGILEGDAQFGSQVVELHRLVTPTLIGKGGANIAKMENELDVKFDVLKAKEQLRIVADSADKVLAARQAVLRFVQSCRVTDTLTTSVTVAKRDADDIVRRAADTFRVEISPAKQSEEAEKGNAEASSTKAFTIKGTFAAVSSCKEYLSQQLVGKSTITVPVAAHHLAALEKQTHGSLKRLQDKNDVALSLISAPSAGIKLAGTIEAVAQARQDLLKLLERYFPSEVQVLEVSASCLREQFGEDFVQQMADTGVAVSVDVASGSVLLVGEADSVAAARSEAEARVVSWADCHTSVTIEPSLVPALVGKGGASINALRKETNVSIEVNASGTCVDLKGSSREQVAAAKQVLEKKIRQLQSERWEHTAAADLLPALIGKQGATINKLRADTGAGIDIDGSTIKVYGGEEKVAAAKAAILDILSATEARQAGSKTLLVPAASIPAIIGAKGATVRELQEKTGVRFDFDRVGAKCSLKGSIEGVESAIKLVNEILEREGFPSAAVEGRAPPAAAAAAAAQSASPEPTPAEEQVIDPAPVLPKTLVGAPPSLLQKVADKNLSKSALKRLRRKQAESAGAGAGAAGGVDAVAEDDEASDDEEASEQPAPSAAPSAAHTIPAPAPTVPVPSPTVSAPVHPPATAVVGASSTASALHSVPAETSVPKLGVIGKSSRLSAAEVDSYRAALPASQSASAPIAHTSPAPTASTSVASAAIPAPIAPPAASGNSGHGLQQQKLIDLLFGDTNAAAELGGVVPPSQTQHRYQPFPTAPVSQPPLHPSASASASAYHQYDHSSATYGHTLYNSSAGQYQPSALYAHAPAPSSIPPPPGMATHRSNSNPLDLNLHAGLPAYTGASFSPPPPGLTPPGGSATSRFTFAEYSAPPAPIAPPTAASASFAAAPGSRPANAPANGPAGNYYKSKSGFSVRL